MTLTINTSGSGTLSGGVAVLDGEGRLAGGTISFTIGILPFQASGKLNIKLQAVARLGDLQRRRGDEPLPLHRQRDGERAARGINVGSATGIISDVGAGASVRVCFFSCWRVGYGLRWANVSSFPPDVDWIGGDTEQYRTISAAPQAAEPGRRRPNGASRWPQTAAALRHGPSDDAKTKFELIGPTGVRYRLGGKRKDLYTEVRADGKVSAIVVYEPKPGTWRLREIDAPKARVRVQVGAQLGRLRTRTLRPTGTTKTPLSRKTVKSVLATWRSTGLPKGTRVDVFVSPTKKGQGARVKKDLRSSGRYRIPMKALKYKTNWVSVVARAEGIAFQRVLYRTPVRVK